MVKLDAERGVLLINREGLSRPSKKRERNCVRDRERQPVRKRLAKTGRADREFLIALDGLHRPIGFADEEARDAAADDESDGFAIESIEPLDIGFGQKNFAASAGGEGAHDPQSFLRF